LTAVSLMMCEMGNGEEERGVLCKEGGGKEGKGYKSKTKKKNSAAGPVDCRQEKIKFIEIQHRVTVAF